jgi:hypothetical protein
MLTPGGDEQVFGYLLQHLTIPTHDTPKERDL